MRAFLLVLSLAACNPATDDGETDRPDVSQGYAAACLTGPWEPEVLWDTQVVPLNGVTVVEDRAGAPQNEPIWFCDERVDRTLVVRDGDGATWELGYAIEDGDGESVTPALDVVVDQSVDLLFREVVSFGDAQGFVLTDAGGVVAALDVGAFGHGLFPEDFTRAQITSGEIFARRHDDCGTLLFREMTFHSQDVITVEPYTSSPFHIDNRAFTAWAIANTEWGDDVRCTDLAGLWMWGITRTPFGQ